MTDPTTPEPQGTPYHVVLLVEKALTKADAAQVHELHTGIEGPVFYHVLMPVEDAAARIEASLGTLSAGDVMAAPGTMMNEVDLAAVRREAEDRCHHDLNVTLRALALSGAQAEGETVEDEPVHALTEAVARLKGDEAIVLTRPHVVAEFLHLDWTSRARRKLGVPVLHLLEHQADDVDSSGDQPESDDSAS